MTALDWVLIVVWSGLTLAGFWNGALRLVFGAGGLISGIWLAVVGGADVAAWLARRMGEGWLAAGLGRLLPFLLCLGLGLAAGWGLARTLSALHLGWVNRLAGAALAAAVAIVLLGAVLITGVRYSPGLAAACARSRVAPVLMGLLREAQEPPPAATVAASAGTGTGR